MMASTHASLDAAATERKARLAKLASLKRKQPPSEEEENRADSSAPQSTSTLSTDPASSHLSLRNYDPETRGPKLGFEAPPVRPDQETLESRAAQLAVETKAQEEKEEKEKAEGKGIDLFDLQPRKPNWDLKRDLARKMEVLQQRTDNAIARLVRERLEKATSKETSKGNRTNGATGTSDGTDEDGNGAGLRGADLVEGIHIREREEEEERRGREEDDDLG